MADGSPLQRYVSEAGRQVRMLPRRRQRQVLAEITDHLCCAADDIVIGAGCDRQAAEAEAVRRFGAPDQVMSGWLAAYGLDLLRRIAWLAGVAVVVVVRVSLATDAGPFFTGGLSSPVVLVALFIISQVAYAAIAVAMAQVWLVRRSVVCRADIAAVRRGVVTGGTAGVAGLSLRAGALLTVPHPGPGLVAAVACAGVLAAMVVTADRIARRASAALGAASAVAGSPVPGVRGRARAVAGTLASSRAARLRVTSRGLSLVTRLPWWAVIASVAVLSAAFAAKLGAAPDGLLPTIAVTPWGQLIGGAVCAGTELAAVAAAAWFVLPALALPGPRTQLGTRCQPPFP